MKVPARVLEQRPRLAHAMLRVADLDRSLFFYVDLLGMTELRRVEFPTARFTLIYLGYQPEHRATALELTYNWPGAAVTPYTHGSGYGHIAIEVDDLYATCAWLRDAGAELSREPGPMLGTPIEIAFVQDPDGYKVELLARPSAAAISPVVA